MIDDSILDKIIYLPEEEEEMETLQDKLQAENFPITNFTKGGVFYHLLRISVKIGIELKELARTILNSCFASHAENDWLDIKSADYSKYRKESIMAKGYITIHRNIFDSVLVISKGHCFKTEPDGAGREYKFYVPEKTVIAAGQDTATVLVEAAEPGTAYNLPSKAITVSMIYLDGVDRITNENEWLYEEGAEAESDESLRKRCLSSYAELATRTIEEKLINAAESVPGVLYARVDAQHPRGQGTVDIIITGSAGAATPELLQKVNAAVNPLKGNYEDYQIKTSETIAQDFKVTVYVMPDTVTDGVADQAEYLIRELMALSRDNLNLFYRDSIIQSLSNHIKGYCKADIIQPAEDVELGREKVIIAGDISVEVKHIGG